jgi:hypothetical protein
MQEAEIRKITVPSLAWAKKVHEIANSTEKNWAQLCTPAILAMAGTIK